MASTKYSSLLSIFHIGKYRFTLKLRESAWLPKYKGGMLRSGFGNLFKQTCCGINQQNLRTICGNCQYANSCAYAYIFNTPLPEQSEYLKSIHEIPRPYLIEPPLDFRREIKADEIFEFNLILIGNAIEFFPYFFVLFKSMGGPDEPNVGLGSSRSKYDILKVTSIDFYNEDWNILYTPNKDLRVEFIESDHITWGDVIRANTSNLVSEKLQVNLVTPMDIRSEIFVNDEKKTWLVKKLDFRYLIRSLLYYISALSYFHCQGEPLESQYAKDLLDKSEKIQILRDDTRVEVFYRMKKKLVGFMGDITYCGDFDEFLPFLYLGELIHAGKGRVMGLGQYGLKWL